MKNSGKNWFHKDLGLGHMIPMFRVECIDLLHIPGLFFVYLQSCQFSMQFYNKLMIHQVPRIRTHELSNRVPVHNHWTMALARGLIFWLFLSFNLNAINYCYNIWQDFKCGPLVMNTTTMSNAPLSLPSKS